MQCFHPIVLKRQGGDYSASSYNSYVVPCGRCLACRSNRSREWSLRLQCEALMSKSVWFVTLTYQDEFLPCVQDTGEVTLCKQDVSSFIKRLRNYLPKLRFFACGEYGDKFGRPHYHILLFFKELVTEDDVFDASSRCWHYNDKSLNPVHVDGFNESVAKYVSKYVIKQLGTYQNKDIQQPFALMSLRPGIGAGIITKEYSDNIRSLNQHFMSDMQGYRYAVPRYYKDMLYSKDEWTKYNEQSALERPYRVPRSLDEVLTNDVKEFDILKRQGLYSVYPSVSLQRNKPIERYDFRLGIEPNYNF